MKRGFSYAVAALGLVGAGLRGLQLHTGYEADTGLPIAGNLYWPALVAFSVLAVALIFLWAWRQPKEKGVPFGDVFGTSSMAYKTIAVCCGAGMVAVGIYGAIVVLTRELPQAQSLLQRVGLAASALVWLLGSAAGLGLVVLAAMQGNRGQGRPGLVSLTAVPMFWAGLALVFTYRDYSAEPALSLFALELFSVIAVMYGLYAQASFLFSFGSVRRFQACSLVACYLLFTTQGGQVVQVLLGGEMTWQTPMLLRQVMLLCCGVFLYANVLITQSRES